MRFRSLAVAGLLLMAFVTPGRADECVQGDPLMILPDLTSLPPRRARVVERQGIRRLYFSSVFANLGVGPLTINATTVTTEFGQQVTRATQVVQKSDGTTCTHDAGTFTFHPTHNHWHLDDFAEYQLRKDDPYTGEIVARGSKISFCLTDIEPQRGFSGQRQVFSTCGVQEGTQGISSGWADVYDDFYPEQYLELDVGLAHPIDAGSYYLVNVANPLKFLIEVDDSPQSNAGFVSISVPGRIGTGPIPTPTQPGPSVVPTPVTTRPPRPTKPPRPTRAPPVMRTPIARP